MTYGPESEPRRLFAVFAGALPEVTRALIPAARLSTGEGIVVEREFALIFKPVTDEARAKAGNNNRSKVVIVGSGSQDVYAGPDNEHLVKRSVPKPSLKRPNPDLHVRLAPNRVVILVGQREFYVVERIASVGYDLYVFTPERFDLESLAAGARFDAIRQRLGHPQSK